MHLDHFGVPMSGSGWAGQAAVVAAIIAAVAAIAAGLIGYFATRNVEITRLKAALVEKAEERKLATLEKFLLSVNDWLDWLAFIDEQGYKRRLEELSRRVKERDDAFRRLMLLASDPLYEWLSNQYSPLEYNVKKTYAYQVRWGKKPDEEAIEARREFSRLLREDMIRRFRPEVAALRDPTHQSRKEERTWLRSLIIRDQSKRCD
jgi:hypothetical protein